MAAREFWHEKYRKGKDRSNFHRPGQWQKSVLIGGQ
jgi:hypothetical protein